MQLKVVGKAVDVVDDLCATWKVWVGGGHWKVWEVRLIARRNQMQRVVICIPMTARKV